MSSATPSKSPRKNRMGKVWAVIWRTGVKYVETDGEQHAASFAYYALFSLLPLLVLLITLAAQFLGDQENLTNQIFALLSQFILVDLGSAEQVRATVQSFMQSRLGSGLISFGILTWCSLRFFHSLVRAVNSAWGTHEYSWWRLPLKNLLMVTVLTSALLIGLVAPVVLNGIEKFYSMHRNAFADFGIGAWVMASVRGLLPPILLFYSLALFYKFAPRRRTTFREVWVEALWVTAALGGLQKLVVIYAGKVANFNVVYGTFGSVVALLLWIYLTGTVIIIGGCACAARTEISKGLADQAVSDTL